MEKEKIDNNIYKTLCDRGITQASFAKKNGIGRNHFNKIINQKVIPGTKFAIRIAKGLNKPVSEVFFFV